MRQLGPGAKVPNAISPSAAPGALPQTAAERSENERLRDRLEKALQVNQLLYNFLEKHTQNQFQTRDATELEAGRLAKELEKAQKHLAKQQEANESTRIEFERMSAELNRLQERLERSESEKEALKLGHGGSRQNLQAQQQIEKNLLKLEAETKQLTNERYAYDSSKLEWQFINVKNFFNRDQLIQQLEKSQDMLMNFQQELNATEQELQRQREENKR